MTKYFRAEAVIRIYIEVPEVESSEAAEEYIRDKVSFESLAKYDTAFLDNVDILRIKEIVPDQTMCDVCGDSRWSDINGCAECGNLNDRWRE